MAALRPLQCVFPQVEPSPADLVDGEKFLDGMITRRKVKSILPRMYLRYGYLMAEDKLPNAASEKQVLDRWPKVSGGEEDENGDRVFDIYISQDNCNYLVTLAFSPKEESDDEDEDSHQEEEEGDQLRGDYYSDDGEETYEDYENDEMEETGEDYESEDDVEMSDDEDLTGNRVFELYFPQGDLHYTVRLIFVKEGDMRFLEEGDEFLFVGLQRVAGISYDEEEEEDEVPAIDSLSSSALEEVVSEISRNLTEANIGERNEIRTTEDPEKQSRIDPLMIFEQRNHLIAQNHLQVHSSA